MPQGRVSEDYIYDGARHKYSSHTIVMMALASSVLWYMSDAIVNAGMSIDINRCGGEDYGWLSVSKVNYCHRM